MALFKSNILAQVSGSMNGITFSHNSGGSYIRNRSIPTNPGTDRQDQVRTSLASIAATWASVLTNDQRAAWRAFGQAVTVTNRLGDAIKLSGIAAFQRVNLFRLSTLGLAMELDPPAANRPAPPPAFESASILNDPVEGMSIELVNTIAGTTNYSIAYYVSGALSNGILFYRGPYLTRGTLPATTANVSIPTGLDPNVYDGTGRVAAKITLYETASGLPIWTVYLDAMEIPPAA